MLCIINSLAVVSEIIFSKFTYCLKVMSRNTFLNLNLTVLHKPRCPDILLVKFLCPILLPEMYWNQIIHSLCSLLIGAIRELDTTPPVSSSGFQRSRTKKDFYNVQNIVTDPLSKIQFFFSLILIFKNPKIRKIYEEQNLNFKNINHLINIDQDRCRLFHINQDQPRSTNINKIKQNQTRSTKIYQDKLR